MLIKIVVIIVVLTASVLSVWKNSVGLIIPLAVIWGYGLYDSFGFISVQGLIILTVVHVLIEGILYWYSNKYREASLAFTGAGIIGFSTAILSSLLYGALLGFFAWWGLIGRLITKPVTIGIKPIIKSFIAGFAKVVYAVAISGVVAYMLF